MRWPTLWTTLLLAGLLTGGATGRAGGIELGPAETLASDAGLELSRQPLSVAGEALIAWRVKLPRDPERWSVEVRAGELALLDGLAPGASEAPWALVNGGFYEVSGSGYAPMGLVLAAGDEVSPHRRRGGSGVLVVDRRGQVSVVHRDRWPEVSAGARHALQSIDRLVDGGRSLVRSDSTRRAPRSAVALTKEAVWLVAVVAVSDLSGQDTQTPRLTGHRAGLTLRELARYLVDLGAEEALNLDGGISTQLAASIGEVRFVLRPLGGTMSAVLVRPRTAQGSARKSNR